MLLFRSEDHIHRWRSIWKQPFGDVLTLKQAWGLAHNWYQEDRRLSNWRRKTKDEALALFRELGLTNEFWNL